VARRAALALAVVALAGCGGHPRLSVTARGPLLDSPVTIRVTGLEPHEHVQLVAATRSDDGSRWRSTTALTADRDGRADLGSHPMRFLEAMRLAARDSTFALRQPRMTVDLALRRGDETLASTTLTRTTVARGVRERRLAGEVVGTHFAPPGDGPRPAVLLLGGSEGGDAMPAAGGLLASHGIEVLTLAYFGEPGLPRHLKRIPLEYVLRGLEWLRRRPGVDPDRVSVGGVSRGGELALLLASTYPDRVDRVAALVPSAFVFPAYDAPLHGAAWTVRGRGVPWGQTARIPVERIRGPLFTVGAVDDLIWESGRFVDEIAAHRHAHDDEDVRLKYERAGHLAGSAIPYIPLGEHGEFGGFPRPDADARADLWPKLVRFLGGT
jgi:dienelactone hydrolase